MDQNYGSEERFRKLNTANMSAVPTAATPPHYAMSARTRNGLPSTGFIATFLDPGAGAPTIGAGGLTITVWRWFPATQQWGRLVPQTGIQLQDVLTCNDLDPAHVYLQVTNASADGDLLVAFQET